MKKIRCFLILAFLLYYGTMVEAKEVNINNPIDLACDFACYYAPKYAIGFTVDNSIVVMNDGNYTAVSVNNVKPMGAGLIVVVEKCSNNIVSAFYCQDYWDDMIYERISEDNPTLYREYNESRKGNNYYTNFSIEDAYKYLVDDPFCDGFYTVYDMNDDGIKEFIYYDGYDVSTPDDIYSRAFQYSNGKLAEIDIDYNSYVKSILNKTQWCKINDISLVNEVFENNISVILNGNEISFEQPPYIENGTTRVPMRAIFEALDAKVEYDANTKIITARKGSTVIELITGASIAKINGREMTLTSSVENKNGSTMVPLRFVSEALGAEVIWNAETKTITINLVETNADKDSLVNPLVGHSNVILTIYDNRNSILDGITWSVANIADGAKHIINIEEEVPDVEQGKCVLASILANVPEIESEPVDASKYADISKLASDGTSIIEDYFGTSTKETKLLQNSIEKLGDIIDWTAFSIEEIDFILRDYKKNIQYFVLLQSNCDDEYVNAVIDDLMQDYTDKWYKTIIDVNEKIADEVVDKGLDVGVGFYTAGLYPLAKYSSEAISTLTGLKGYTDSLANFYQVCRMIYPVDNTLDIYLTKYKNGECSESELQAVFELNKATKIYAYECIAEFGKESDKDKAYVNIQDVKRFTLNNGEIVYNGGNGGGGMGFR